MISDPIEFELFKNALFGIADEMALTVFRTTYSGVLKDNMDYSTALFDGDGVLVAQGLTLPGHLGSMPTAIAAVKAAFAGRVFPGDLFILNDPFQGGMHLPDVFVFQPIFRPGENDDSPIAWAGTVSHHTDVGGRVPGSNASDSTEIYQEGLRIPPLKLFERGVRNETLFALIEKNVRVPVKVFGDLRAQLAACHIAEQAMLDLATHYGTDKLATYMTELVDYAERMTRAALRDLPDGVYDFLDHIDDDGIDGGNTGVSIGGYHADRSPFIYVDFTCCAWGARPYADGLDGNSHIYANMASQPIEVTETEQPLQITAYEFIQDAMGPGKFRGGAPFRREYKLLAPEAVLQVRSDRRDFRPFGLYGGGPGRPSMNYLNPDRNPAPLPSNLTTNTKEGDPFRHEVAGAGGWRDPLERDPALVLNDVRNEFVSLRAAREDYGVVLGGKPLAGDGGATAAVRQQI